MRIAESILIALLIVAGGVACAPKSPLQVAKDMRAAACVGDVQGWFARTDQSALSKALADGILHGMRKRAAEHLSPPAVQVLMDGLEPDVRDGAATYLQRLDTMVADDIKRGRDGYTCKIVIGEQRIIGNEAHVIVTGASGVRRDWGFKLLGDKWMVMARSVLPEDQAKADALPPEPNDPPVPTAPRVPDGLWQKVTRTEMAYRASEPSSRQ